MKYVYLIVVLAAAVLIVISGINTDSVPTVQNTLPDDEVHQGAPGLGKENPSKDNVSSEFLHQLEMYKKKIDENPEDTLSIRKYAELLSAGHKADEGIKYYEKIIAIDPGRIDVLTSVVYNYYTMRRMDKAAEYNEKILKIDPNNSDAIYNKGVIEATIGNTDAAKKIWEDLIKKAPDSKVAKMAKQNLETLANSK